MRLIYADYSDPAASERVPWVDDIACTERLIAKINEYGFAIAAMPLSSDANPILAMLADSLGLGQPYIPQLYRLPKADYGSSYVDIRPTRDANHPSFSSGNAQRYHTDGLLETLGTIRTSMLYCVNPASAGGMTIVLNSAAIFQSLRELDAEAAQVLVQPHILGRKSTLPGIDAETIGPAFEYEPNGDILTRFGDGEPENWYPEPDERDALIRALAHFEAAGAHDGQLRRSLLLDKGDCLIFRNDWISHGRDAFIDDPKAPRHLVRALYLAAPCETANV